MGDITIRPTMQVLFAAGVIAAVAAAIVAQLPELQRYLKVRRM